MIEQLDVFLAEETKPFVERLFEAINSEEYLKTPPPTANPKSTTTDNEDEETSTAEKTVQSSVSDASSLSTLPTSSSNITNVIKQNDSDTISNVTAKITDNVAASSSSYTADRINTPPIEEVSNVYVILVYFRHFIVKNYICEIMLGILEFWCSATPCDTLHFLI